MSDAVIVGLIAGAASIISTAIGMLTHRKHEKVARETMKIVNEIHVATDGQMTAVVERINRLEGGGI